MNNFERTKEFVVKQRWEYDFPLTRETTLRKDLIIYGDDAAEFMEAFGKEFKVDLSKFDFDKYFPPEGDFILPAILRFLGVKKATKYLPLTLGDLETSISSGVLE